MALNFNEEVKQVKNKKIQSLDSSSELKQMLSEKQLDLAKRKYMDIRKSFYDSGCPLTRHDKELAELIRLKILDMMLAEDF